MKISFCYVFGFLFQVCFMRFLKKIILIEKYSIETIHKKEHVNDRYFL
jgi:hypothetical protein